MLVFKLDKNIDCQQLCNKLGQYIEKNKSRVNPDSLLYIDIKQITDYDDTKKIARQEDGLPNQAKNKIK